MPAKNKILSNFKKLKPMEVLKTVSNLQRLHENHAKEQTELKLGLLNAERLAVQLNNKPNKKIYGKAAQYKYLLKFCQFKIWVKFHVNKQGRPYTQIEKDANLNRQYIPSLDLIREGGRNVINLEIAYSELTTYLLQNANRIEAAQIYLNDWVLKEESLILIFNPREPALSQYIDIYFKPHPITGGVLIDRLERDAYRIDKMKFNLD